jgi:DNA gyrase subunit A
MARLEIHIILEELAEKRAAAERIEGILSSDGELWAQVRSELRQLRKAYGVDRRTGFLGEEAPTPQYSEDAYIVREDAFVIATREGWFKRQGSFSEVEKIRVREGDTVGWLGLGDTRQTVTFFTSRGGAYTMRIADVPVTTGHGEPIQRHFSFEDGERVVGVVVHDPRSLPAIDPAIVAASTDEAPAPPHAVAISRNGRCLRFPLAAHAEPSNKNGRRYMKTDEEGDEVVIVMISDASEHLCLVSEGGKALCFPVTEINMVKAAGKGVQAIKLSEDRVYAAALTSDLSQGVAIVDSMERTHLIHPARHLGPRAGSGSPLWRNRSRCQRWDQPVLRLDLLRQPGILMLSPTPRPTES